jgi:hypothetical protein
MKKIYLLIACFSGILITVVLLGAINLQASAASVDDPGQTAVSDALVYIKSLQDPTTGGYGTGSATMETTLSIGAAGEIASEWRNGENSLSLLDYWTANAREYTQISAGEAGKLALGLVDVGGCWPFEAVDIENYYDPQTGIYDEVSINQAFAMLGLVANNQPVPDKAVAYLKSLMQSDGGWKLDYPGATTDSNTTALVVQALISAGETPTTTEVISGMNYIKNSQSPSNDGGFFYTDLFGTDSDTNSTAYAVQAIVAAGEDPTSGRWVVDSTNPISYLLDMQLPDGSFEWMPGMGSNLFATQQVVPALLQKPFPLKIGELDACPVYIPLLYR